MKIINKGHIYSLEHLDGDKTSTLNFVKRGRGENDAEGITNQEVLRVLIDRVKFLEEELHWEGNKEIIYHLRMALVLHESRHLIRAVEKGDIEPENIVTANNGHFKLTNR